MKPISNNTRPLPCHDTPGVSVGLGIITPCLFLSVCLNCFLYKRLKKAENVALFEGFRRSLRRGESDRLLDNDTDDTDDNRRSSYKEMASNLRVLVALFVLAQQNRVMSTPLLTHTL